MSDRPQPQPASAASLSRVWRVGRDIDTDQLAPGAFMKYGIDVIARHCLEAVRPDFASGVTRGDVLVAGPGFGIGSSREQAAAALVELGVRAVVAPTYGGLFFRNAFNAGLLLLTCDDAERMQERDVVRIDLDGDAPAVHLPNRDVLRCDPIPAFLRQMVADGGLLAQLKRRHPLPSRRPLSADEPPSGVVGRAGP